MREIKFRGKIKGQEDWACGDLHHGIFTASPYVCGIGVDPETVGQYTGLKDKNGVEIYEGDIVRLLKPTIAKIIFGFCGFEFEWITKRTAEIRQTKSEPMFQNTPLICAVIGNIHDNPELLEAQP